MNQAELKKRTRSFTIKTILFVKSLPKGRDAWYLGDQLYRAASSVGANYRAACRSKTKPTFIHKMSVVEEEADECCFWLDIMAELNIGSNKIAKELFEEADQLTAIFTASNRTLSQRK